MPLKLVPPRKGNPNYCIRGSYLNVKRLYVSSGSPEKRVAEQALRKLKRDIESGALAPEAGPTFASAALSYVRAGGERRFLEPLNEYFKDTPLHKINQAAIDKAADKLHPGDPAEMAMTRNRQIYTPISAILKHAGIEKKLKRPKGWQGKPRLHWLKPEDAFKLIDAAANVGERVERSDNGLYVKTSSSDPSPRFQALLEFLLYTGCRLSEALRLRWDDVILKENFAFIRDTKTGVPRPTFLTPSVVAALANLERDKRGSVFGYSKTKAVYHMLDRASKVSGVPIPDGVAFHLLRHTYGAWMRRFAGLDTSGLVRTGAWKSLDAARVYEHAEFNEEARKAALLPTRSVIKA